MLQQKGILIIFKHTPKRVLRKAVFNEIEYIAILTPIVCLEKVITRKTVDELKETRFKKYNKGNFNQFSFYLHTFDPNQYTASMMCCFVCDKIK